MRTVFTNEEVARVWYRQEQNEGRGSGGNLYFHGNTIYSYGSHFPIAKILDDGKILFTTRSYSNSTAKHINYVWRAVGYSNKNVMPVYNPDASHSTNIKHWLDIIDNTVMEIRNKKNRKFEGRLQTLKSAANSLKQYTEYFGITLTFEQATILAFVLSDKDIVKELRS